MSEQRLGAMPGDDADTAARLAIERERGRDEQREDGLLIRGDVRRCTP